MKTRLLSILLTIMMVLSVFALTSCEGLIDSLLGKNEPSHEHEWSEWETIKSSDCQNPGIAERYCDCGETQTKSLPVTIHVESDWIIDKEATCISEGSKHKECTTCNITLVSEKIVKADHDYGEWIEEIPATTESDGNLGHYHCYVCGKNFDADKKELNSIVIPQLTPHEHTYGEWTETKAPDCDDKGEERRDCSVCDHFETREVEALGHDKVHHDAKDATCADIGWNTYEDCSRCDYTTYVEIPTTNEHVYGEWTETKASDCDDKGEERRDCSVCDHFETREAEALGHDKVHHDAKDATCADIGWNTYETCTRCSYSTYVEIPALDHDVSDWILVKEPTYEKTGLKHKVCIRCSTILKEEIIPKLVAVEHNIYYHDIDINDDFPESFVEHLGLYDLPEVEKAGHDKGYWRDEYGNKVFSIPTGTNKDVHLYAVLGAPTQYKIKYSNAAQNSNPTTYTIYDEITFSNPNWPGLIFSHWSDEYGNKVTSIEKGTIGDITLEANWKYAKNLAISNPDKYTYVCGMMDSNCNYYFIYDIGTIENIVLSTKYTQRYDGSNVINRTETVTYKVQTSEAQTVASSVANSVINTYAYTNIEEWITENSNTKYGELNFCPEVEVLGIKAKLLELKHGSSSTSKEDAYTETKSSTTTNGTESSTSYEINSYISYVYEEETSSNVSINLSPSTSPSGTYSYVRAADVRVYAIVVYDANSDQYFLEIYTMVENVYDRTLFELASGEQYDVNIEKCDQLSFDLPMSVIPESFYTVKYDANGGKGTMLKSVHEVGVASSILSNEFTRDGYIFSGWKTSKDGSAAIYQNSATILDAVKAGETLTLYAHWTPITFTVKYDPNGGSGTMYNSTFVYDKEGQTFTKNVFSRTGYTFLGWSTDKNAKAASYTDESKALNLTTTPGATITLYAIWSANSYTVTYDANGGNGSCKDYATYNLNYTIKDGTGISRTNHIFLGWSLDPNDKTPDFKGNEVLKYTFTQDYTLYAVWTPTKSSWNNGLSDSNYMTVRNDGIEYYLQTGLDREALRAAGYTMVSITGTIRGERIYASGAGNWYIDFYDRNNAKIHNDEIGKFNTSFETRNIQYTLSIDCIRDDGTIKIRFDHLGGTGIFGEDRGQYRIGLISITSTAE